MNRETLSIKAALEGKRGRPGLRLLLLFFAAVLSSEQVDLEHSQLLFEVLEWGWYTQGLGYLLAGLCVDAWSTHAAVSALEAEQQLQWDTAFACVFFQSPFL